MIHGYDFFDLNDIPCDEESSPLNKTFESLDPFAEEPDVSSEFARCHSPEYAAALEKAWVQHRALTAEELDGLTAGRKLEKRVTLSKPHYLKAMKQWLAKGEDIESFILGSHESIREELRSLAQQENYL